MLSIFIHRKMPLDENLFSKLFKTSRFFYTVNTVFVVKGEGRCLD